VALTGQRVDCSEETVSFNLCIAYHHPGFFGFMIILRWFHLFIHLLGTRAVGQNVLPAISAITRNESLYYVSCLLLILMGSFHAYYSFAIEENVGSENDLTKEGFLRVTQTFLKIYRLTFMGDFDLFELEGVDEAVTGEIHGKVTDHVVDADIVSGQVDDGDPTKSYLPIRLFFVVLSIVSNIMLMNVYIGLLSSLYDEAKAKKKHLHFHHLADLAYQYVVRRLFWEQCCCLPPDDDETDLSMIWFAVEDQAATEEPQTEDAIFDMQKKIVGIEGTVLERMDVMTKKIEELTAQLSRRR